VVFSFSWVTGVVLHIGFSTSSTSVWTASTFRTVKWVSCVVFRFFIACKSALPWATSQLADGWIYVQRVTGMIVWEFSWRTRPSALSESSSSIWGTSVRSSSSTSTTLSNNNTMAPISCSKEMVWMPSNYTELSLLSNFFNPTQPTKRLT